MARSRSCADVRIGIVGCGRAATSLHVPALARVRGVRVVALADLDPGRLRRLASRCDGATLHADYATLLADERVDLVAVCVPVTLHEAVAGAALGAGKHVFIEKPLAFTLEQCDRLVAAAAGAESRGIRAAVGFNLRSHRLVRQARAIVEAGRLGQIEVLRTVWTADWSGGTASAWHAERSQGGGALLEIGTHQADLWRYLLGAEVEAVNAMSRSLAFDDQTAVLQARMSGGVLVSAAASRRSVSRNTIEIDGDRGSLRLSCYHGDSLEVWSVGGQGGGLRRRLGGGVARAARLPAALNAARQGGDFQVSYVRQWQRIVAALADGGPMPASVEDGRQAVRVVLAALRSSDDGSIVSLGQT